MSSERKIGEALEHIQQAEKCLKTSLFKWNPDLDGAASEYLKAATCYRNARMLTDARDSFLKAADIQEKMKAPFHAAKAYEQAGLICKENKELDIAVKYMERASLMFQEHGTPDTAALCLEKAAKMVEQTSPLKAAELYKKASEVAELEDRPRQSAENIGKAARILVRLQEYEEALNCLVKEIEFYERAENYAMISKLVVGVVLVKLTLGDNVDADKFYASSLRYPQFSDSEESAAIQELLQAFDDGDEENARRVLSLPLIKYMDNVFAKLARDLKIPGGMRVGKQQQHVGDASAGTNEPPNAGSGVPFELDLEDGEGLLC